MQNANACQPAVGIGFEVSLAGDFRLVTDTTLYALPEQKLWARFPAPAAGHACRKWSASPAPKKS